MGAGCTRPSQTKVVELAPVPTAAAPAATAPGADGADVLRSELEELRAQLEAERKAREELELAAAKAVAATKSSASSISVASMTPLSNASGSMNSAVVRLNVGGRPFKTTCATLLCSQSQVLRSVLADSRSVDGEIFLDRDGRHFHHILNFIRDGPEKFCAPDDENSRRELRHEALFYGLAGLAAALSDDILSSSPSMVSGTQSQLDGANGKEYVGAPIPHNEVERLQRLEGLHILHTDEAEYKYDNITRIVAALFEVPTVLVSLIHERDTWFKSRFGMDACSAGRPATFCAYLFTPEDPKDASMLNVEDLSLDPRFMNNPLVSGEAALRFYAGSPLVTSDGYRLGALCAIDVKPRKISALQAQLLVSFSTIVIEEIERGQLLSAAAAVMQKLRGGVPPSAHDFTSGPLRAERMRAALSEAVLLVNVKSNTMDWPILYANEGWSSITWIRIRSPSSLSEPAVADGPGLACVSKGQTTVHNPMIWDWLVLSPSDYGMVAQQLKESWMHDEPNMFSLTATMLVPTPYGEPAGSVQVSCRFMPASQPLDINAAAIQPVPKKGAAQAPTPESAASEHLYFVTVVFDSPPAETLAIALPRDSINEESCPQSRKDRILAGKDKTATALDSIRPPVSPFLDVTLIRLVAKGSYGKVYFGLWCGSSVAVKVMVRSPLEEKTPKRKGKRRRQSTGSRATSPEPAFEAALSVSISHPNLVQSFKYASREVSTVGYPEGPAMETWIVQEWCEGGTLGQFCKKDRIVNKELCLHTGLDICLDIARAGAYLHSRGIIHGDLSPNNVLLKGNVSSKGFVCKLCDFGLARVLDGDPDDVKSGAIGTLTHMPPESLDRDCHITEKVDVWSCGILLWQVLTRKVPYSGLTWPELVLHVSEGRRPAFPTDEEENMTVKDLYDSLTAKVPNERPQFNEVVDHLEQVCSDITATGTVSSGARWLHRIRQTTA